MATSKGRRGASSSRSSTSSSNQNDVSPTRGSSQADGSVSAQDGEDNEIVTAQTVTRGRPKRSRDNRTGSKTSDAARRGKNEPGQYQRRDVEQDLESDLDDDDSTGTGARGLGPRNMESAFDDDDLETDSLYDYDIDEADDDIDWDDLPPRGGGRSPDR